MHAATCSTGRPASRQNASLPDWRASQLLLSFPSPERLANVFTGKYQGDTLCSGRPCLIPQTQHMDFILVKVLDRRLVRLVRFFTFLHTAVSLSLSLSLTPDLRQHTDRTESLIATMVSLIPHSCGFGQQSGIVLHPCHSFLHPSLEYSDAQVRGEEGYSNLPSLLRPAHRVHGAQPSSLVLLSLLATML